MEVATLGTPRPSGEVLQKGPTNWKKMPRLPRLRRIQTLHPPWPFSSFLAAAPYVLLASNWLILVHFDLCRIWIHSASPLSIWCIARIYRKTNLLPCKTSSTPRHVKSLLAASNAGPGTWIVAASWLFEKLCGKQSGCCETKMYLAWCWLWHRFGHEACTGTLPGQLRVDLLWLGVEYRDIDGGLQPLSTAWFNNIQQYHLAWLELRLSPSSDKSDITKKANMVYILEGQRLHMHAAFNSQG